MEESHRVGCGTRGTELPCLLWECCPSGKLLYSALWKFPSPVIFRFYKGFAVLTQAFKPLAINSILISSHLPTGWGWGCKSLPSNPAMLFWWPELVLMLSRVPQPPFSSSACKRHAYYSGNFKDLEIGKAMKRRYMFHNITYILLEDITRAINQEKV